MSRILVCEFHQESNSFNPVVCPRSYYEYGGIFSGSELVSRYAGTQTALGGFLSVLTKENAEIIPSISFFAEAAGPVDHSVVQEFIDETLAVIEENGPFDGACVSLHGATQSTKDDDVCGLILETLRKALGRKTLISSSYDLHANITEKIRTNSDFICGYHTYPHIDHFDTGVRTARMLMENLSGRVSTRRAFSLIPLLVPANAYTTMHGPASEIIALGDEMVREGIISDYSVFFTQPWLDVKCNHGSEVICFSEDEGNAIRACRKLASALWERRTVLKCTYESAETIIRKAEKNTDMKPIVLADSSDSCNAGACGDSAFVLGKIVEMKSDVRAALTVVDVPSIEKAEKIGVGGTGEFEIGATKDRKINRPVKVTAHVVSIHDGSFVNEGPKQAGVEFHLGKVAVLRVRNTLILLTPSVSQPGDPQFYKHFGIDHQFRQLVCVKACTSFRAAYERISKEIISADTPGAASANLVKLPFENVSRSFYPFDENCAFDDNAVSF